MTKTVYIKTYGCQMNVYDSERMREQLARAGYRETAQIDAADLVVFNTCHIRELAAEKVYSDVGRIRRMKQRRQAAGGDLRLVITGCLAQAEGKEIIRRASTVDLVIGPQSYHRLPELLQQQRISGKPMVETEFPAEEKFATLARQGQRLVLNAQVSAFVTVQEGCDKFCTFCVVPYTRGAEFSRHSTDIIDEVRQLVSQGVREVTLLGQNVNGYHGTGATGEVVSLAGLVAQLSHIDGLERIRYTTSHPRDMTADLIATHAENPKLMPYLHLPVQSGSDRILKAMNRGHSRDDYLKLIEKVRLARHDIALSGDFIVGFPGETEQDFEETLALIRHVGYASAFSFKYSTRPGTPAAELSSQVPDEEALDRLYRLQTLIQTQQTAFNRACVGKVLPVLFEKPGRDPGQIVGRSPYQQSVHVTGDLSEIGTVRNLLIADIGSNSLLGQDPASHIQTQQHQFNLTTTIDNLNQII